MNRIKQITLILLLALMGTSALQANPGLGKATRPRIDRGITKTTFVNKGQWFIGARGSYQSFNMDNYQLLFMLDNMKANAYSLSGSIQAGYAWKDDIASGIGLEYSRTMIEVPNIDIKLGDDLDLSITHFASIQQVYTGTAFLRAYLNLGSTKRFALFNDVRFNLGGGQSRMINGLGEQQKGTYQNIFRAGLVLHPGILVFITDNVAVEASMGLFGVSYNRNEQITNQVYKGSQSNWEAKFKLNLFSLNMGMSFYF